MTLIIKNAIKLLINSECIYVLEGTNLCFYWTNNLTQTILNLCITKPDRSAKVKKLNDKDTNK